MAKAMVAKLKIYRDMVGPDAAKRIEKEIDHEFCYGQPKQHTQPEQAEQAGQPEQALPSEQARKSSNKAGRFHR
jgi:hypothetical protein